MKRYWQEFTKRYAFFMSLSFVVFSLLAIGFVKIARDVRENDTLGFDRAVLLWIHDVFSSKFMDTVIPVLTNVGGTVGIIVIGGLITGLFAYKKQFARMSVMLAGIGGAVILNLLLKHMFERVRPDLWQQLVLENSFSFPSGHSMASSALAFCVMASLWNTKWRWWALGLGTAYTVFVGFTRIYLGVHYPTDVLGGWIVSGAWVLLVRMLLKSRLVK